MNTESKSIGHESHTKEEGSFQANRRDRSRSPVGKGQRNGSGGDQRKRPDKFGRLPSTRQVCVANIPYSMTWQELKDLFRDKIGDVTYVRLFEDDEGRSRGCGIVEFAQPGAVAKALGEMHRHEINGRRLVVKEDYEVERDRHGKPVNSKSRDNLDARAPGNMRRGRSPDRQGDGNRWGNDRNFNYGPPERPNFDNFGFSQEFLESLNIKGPLINRVFVSNIDYNVGERKLKEVFRMAGKIESIDFMKDKDGKSRGRAVIEYEHPVEAVQAISMLHKQKLFDRVMCVELDKLYKNDENRSYDSLPGGLKSIGRGLGSHGQPLSVGGGIGNNSFGPPAPVPPIPNMGNLGAAGFLGNVPGMDLGNMNSSASMAHPALASLSQQQLLSLINSGLLSGAGPGTNNSNSMANILGGGLRGESSNSSGNSTGIAGLSNIGPSIPFNNSNTGSNYDASSGYPEDNDRRMSRNEGMFNENTRSDTVSVRNLPHHYTWEILREKFHDIGDVMFAEIRSRGSGLVRFASFRDAERAVNLMNGTRIDGRPIDVKMYDFVR